MRFGPVPVARAAGATLAHALRLPGVTLRKGHLVTGVDCAALAAAGVAEVIVARLEDGDLAEDAAAAALGSALAAPGLTVGAAATGRVNLYATGPGLLRVNRDRVAAVNGVHPMITLATLAPFARVQAGAMVATVKIIAWAVPQAALAQAAAVAVGALGHAAPVMRAVTLIETLLPGADPGPKGRQAMALRAERLGLRLTPPVRVAHEQDALARAISDAPGEAVMILTASATSDENDVGPRALRAAGGTLTRFGMPVDPGNLLFLGERAGRPVIGLPGCARSPALNGADWVLERLFCGIAVTSADIAAMGVGGLLKEMPSRPRKRGQDGPDMAEP